MSLDANDPDLHDMVHVVTLFKDRPVSVDENRNKTPKKSTTNKKGILDM